MGRRQVNLPKTLPMREQKTNFIFELHLLMNELVPLAIKLSAMKKCNIEELVPKVHAFTPATKFEAGPLKLSV